MVDRLTPGLYTQLSILVGTFERGSSGYEIPNRELPRSSRWYNPALRRMRLLVKYECAEEIDAAQPSWRAFRITGKGLALHDKRRMSDAPVND